MTLKYRYFMGGEYNPFREDRDRTYSRLTDEARLTDPDGERELEVLFPKLDSWPDFLIAESKNTFWEMEHDIFNSGEDISERVEMLWRDSVTNGRIGEWLKKAEADESDKAMALYMATQHQQFDQNDFTVDFRLYFTESKEGKSLEEKEEFYLNPYEG